MTIVHWASLPAPGTARLKCRWECPNCGSNGVGASAQQPRLVAFKVKDLVLQ